MENQTKNRIVSLDALGQLNCSGADARTFLHGQLTAPIDTLEAGQSQLAALCRSDGRTLASLVAWRQENGISLIIPRGLLEEVSQHLQKFILRADVKITENPAGLRGHWSKPESDGPAPWPVGPERWLTTSSSDNPVPGHEFDADWLRADLQAGLAWLQPETSGRFLPQELGLDQVGAVSYEKGCYPGQEIVARVHYLGRAKKRLVLAGTDTALNPGTVVHDAGEKQAGTVINCAANDDAQSPFLIQLVLGSSWGDNRELWAGNTRLLVSQTESN